MKKGFLYFLLFEGGEYFKIGITGNLQNRIRTLRPHYTLDLENSFYLYLDMSVAIVLERLLKIKFKYCGEIGVHGYTEVYDIKCLEEFLKIIFYLFGNFDKKKIQYKNRDSFEDKLFDLKDREYSQKKIIELFKNDWSRNTVVQRMKNLQEEGFVEIESYSGKSTKYTLLFN